MFREVMRGNTLVVKQSNPSLVHVLLDTFHDRNPLGTEYCWGETHNAFTI